MSVPLVRNPQVQDFKSLGFFMSAPVAVSGHFSLIYRLCADHPNSILIPSFYIWEPGSSKRYSNGRTALALMLPYHLWK
jgi:hypothetical protein